MFHIPGMYDEIIQDKWQTSKYHAWNKYFVNGWVEDDVIDAQNLLVSIFQKHKTYRNT